QFLFTSLLLFLFIPIISPFFGAEYAVIYAQTDNADAGDTNSENSEFPEKMKERKTWEWILSSPGLLINLPLNIIFKSIGAVISIDHEIHLVTKITELLTSQDGLRAVRPIYSASGGAGFKYYHKDIFNKNSRFQLAASAGLRYRQKYELSLTRLSLFGKTLFGDIFIGYNIMPDEPFYGISQYSSRDDESLYTHEKVYAYFHLGTQFNKEIAFRAEFDFEQNNILEGRDLDDESVTDIYTNSELPGLQNKLRLIGTNLNIIYNSRNVSGGPTSGQNIDLSGGLYQQADGNDYSFWKFSADIRQYIHLFYGRTIELRFAGEMTQAISHKKIPFYHLSELGDEETIRGFDKGRYRDRNKILGSIEYRYPIWNRFDNTIDAFLFIDAGQVAYDIKDEFDFDNVNIGFGGGLRLWSSESEFFRITIGKSKERYRLYFSLNK
ncbi:MAG: BamA/TamA family outer membrane protein, partial [candidate division Zixibacteria bacterium]|nr:BamA/TamA family outer membrane protein [candidate division Zixibacteria bacterium]